MKKIKINEKEFFVINGSNSGRYTLCVAAEPWGESIWGKGCNGQTILDIADNRNPESLTYEWFQGLPEEFKSAMKTVRVTTNDENSDGTGVIKQTEMFVPSISEWILIPVDIRRTVSNDNVIWTRSFRIITGGYHGAWCIEKEGISSYYGVGYIYGVIPAFYLEKRVLKTLMKDQNQVTSSNHEGWTIAVCDSEGDGISIYRTSGKYGTIKRIIQNMMREAKEREEDAFDYSIPAKGNENKTELYGCIVCADHHIDFTAKQDSTISYITENGSTVADS